MQDLKKLELRTSNEVVRDTIREILRAAHKDHGHYTELPRDPNPIEVPGFDFSTPFVDEAAADGHYSLLGMSIYGKVFALDTSTLTLDGEQLSGSGWAFVLTPGGIDYYSWQLWDCNAIESNSPNIVLSELAGGWDGDRPTPIFADFGEDVEFTASDNITPVVPHKGLGSLFKNSLTGDIFYWDGNLWNLLVSEPEWEAITGKPTTFPPSAHTHTRVLTAADKLPGTEGDKLVITQAGEYYVDSETGLCYIELPSDGFPGLLHISNATSEELLVFVPGSGIPVATITPVSIAHLAFLGAGWYAAPTPTRAATASSSVGITMTASNANVIIYMTNVAPAQILLRPAETSSGFHCTVVRLGAEVTFVTDTGTIKSVDDYVKIDKVNGAAGVLQLDATNFLLSGQLGA